MAGHLTLRWGTQVDLEIINEILICRKLSVVSERILVEQNHHQESLSFIISVTNFRHRILYTREINMDDLLL